MKKTIAVIFTLFSLGITIGQTKSIPIPDYTDQIYYYDTINNELLKLEQAAPQGRIKSNAFNPIPKKPRIQFTVDGKKSKFRLKSNQSKTFLLKLSNPDIDPSRNWNLFPFEIVGKNRIATLSKLRDGIHGAKFESMENDLINFLEFKKVSSNVCLIKINKSLEPGEYTFTYSLTPVIQYSSYPSICFSFGVD